ncbi:MAG: CcmD family protein [Acidobacteriota bacterium]
MDGSKWQNLGYLFWAYTLIWGLLAAYLLRLGHRLRHLHREVETLRQETHRDDPA